VEDAVGLIVLKLLLLLSVLKPVKKKIQKAGQGKYISHARIHVELTCDFSPIYNSEGLISYDYTSKKQLKSVIYVQLAVSILGYCVFCIMSY
jgi:hypothetical protein